MFLGTPSLVPLPFKYVAAKGLLVAEDVVDDVGSVIIPGAGPDNRAGPDNADRAANKDDDIERLRCSIWPPTAGDRLGDALVDFGLGDGSVVEEALSRSDQGEPSM